MRILVCVLIGFGLFALITVALVIGAAVLCARPQPSAAAAPAAPAWSQKMPPPPAPDPLRPAAVAPPKPPPGLFEPSADELAELRAEQLRAAERAREAKSAAARAKAEAAEVKAVEQMRADRAAKLRKGIEDCMREGSLRKIRGSEFWVDPLAWLGMNRDQKEGFTLGCAAYSELQGGARSATIRSYANDAIFAETTWLGDVRINF